MAARGKADVIQVTETIALDPDELEESFIRSSGPGGQNVNKLSTAVQLRFDVRGSRSLPNDVALRLMRLAGHRLTQEGVLIITAQDFRSQERNRAAARERLFELIRAASVPPKRRRPTRPSGAAQARRRSAREQRSGIKRLRQSKPDRD